MAWITAVTTALVLALLLRPADAKGRQPQPGEPAPDFALETLDGQVVRLSDLRGQVVLLNFWATWCPPCREEMPALQAVERLYREKGFRVLAINLDESPATIRSFLEQNGLELTVLLDKDMKVTSRYGILPLPTSFFIDREGRVAYVHERYMDLAFVKGQVEQLLGIR
ncbi:MAG: TlpA disulfide reductase family protein [Bacillota bacterium]